MCNPHASPRWPAGSLGTESRGGLRKKAVQPLALFLSPSNSTLQSCSTRCEQTTTTTHSSLEWGWHQAHDCGSLAPLYLLLLVPYSQFSDWRTEALRIKSRIPGYKASAPIYGTNLLSLVWFLSSRDHTKV